MKRRYYISDTADRMIPRTIFRLGRRELLVEAASAESPTASRPGRIAVTAANLHGSLAGDGEVIYLDAGEIVPQIVPQLAGAR